MGLGEGVEIDGVASGLFFSIVTNSNIITKWVGIVFWVFK